MINLALALVFLSPTVVMAATDCTPIAQVAARIRVCSQNMIAVEAAKSCAEQIRQSWQRQSQETAKRLEEMQANMKNRQQGTMSTSEDSYQRALEDLYRELTSMQRNTSLAASYAEAMMDFADKDTGYTAICFETAIAALQPVITGLDKEIIAAKKVYEKTLALRNATGEESDDLDEAIGGAPPAILKQKPQGQGAPTNVPKNRDSDVSGIKEDKAKQKPLK